MSLNTYLRDVLHFTGYILNIKIDLHLNRQKIKLFFFYIIVIKRTKVTCKEGGCGACLVKYFIYMNS
jgi:hypothetical protein